ncbi:hypothetical protein BH09VER1_BH09VER1_02440 [soil metagenome]
MVWSIIAVNGGSLRAAELSPELQAKQKAFKTAWDLIQQKQYSPALDILTANLKAYPDAPTVDYEYVWSMYCLVFLGKYADLPTYYAKVSELYLGEVIDPVSGMKRNWGSKLLTIGCRLNESKDPAARETLKALAKIDQDRIKASGVPAGPRETHPFDYIARGSIQVPESDILTLASIEGGGGTYEITASKEQFLKSPAWSPEDGKPPLAARDVAKTATQFIQSNGFPAAHIESIELRQQPALEKRWYYLVTFEQKDEGSLLRSPYKYVAILLDGMLLPAKRPDPFHA